MGTIVMAANRVIEAADTTIARIEAKRAEKNERMIQLKIENSIPGRLRKFFGASPLTKEQAIKALLNDGWFFFPSEYAWGDLQHAKKLKKLAQHGDPVTLNEEDIRVLF